MVLGGPGLEEEDLWVAVQPCNHAGSPSIDRERRILQEEQGVVVEALAGAVHLGSPSRCPSRR